MGEGTTLSPLILRAVREFQQATRVQRVIVFGSHASGTPSADSDVDLVLIDPRFEGVKSFRRSRGLRQFWPLDLPVDMLCYTAAEFEALRLRPTIAREAAEHGIEA